MKIIAIVVLALSAAYVAGASAQVREEFRDRNGAYLGSSTTWNGTTSFRDSNGTYLGEARRDGSRVEMFNSAGRYLGDQRRETLPVSGNVRR
jgi:hypothetical protein